jgi:flavin reductase (DIM6/NTAB) family NADH-FMN oxidoreductase RutF
MEHALNPQTLRRFAGCFPTGVAILTTRSRDGELFGATLNSVTSLSLSPPLYLICLDAVSRSLGAIKESGEFCLNFLSSHQHGLARLFASKADDKFSEVEYSLSESGVPVLSGCLAMCLGRVTETHAGGDHTIIIGHVRETAAGDGEPLVFYRGQFGKVMPHPELFATQADSVRKRVGS